MSYHWIPSSIHQGLPMGANVVHAGNDSDGSPIYVGRAFHAGENLPAKIIPSKQACYVAYNGVEESKDHFEYLSGCGFTWIASANGHAPNGAVISGKTSDGEDLKIGRTHHEGSLTPGKVHSSHGCIYFPYGGVENSSLQYEVLVCNQKAEWRHFSCYDSLPANAIYAGADSDGSAVYVGRCHHNGDILPAKVIPSKQIAYVAWGGLEHPHHHCELLCNGNVHWIPSGNGQAHPNAVRGGNTAEGETLFIGRAHHEGSLTPGKIQPSHSCLYIPYGGAEVAIGNYEILVEY